jgi:hypothetical protein
VSPVFTADGARRALLAQFLRIAQRRFNLVERVPKRFAARGWDLVGDRVEVATAALAMVAMRQGKVKLRIFPGTDDPPEWKGLVGFSEASRIVEALELGDLIKSETP